MLKVRVHTVMFFVLCSVTSKYVKLRSSKCITIQQKSTTAVVVALFIGGVCIHQEKLKVHNTIFLVPAVLIGLTDLLSCVNNIFAIIIKFCRIQMTKIASNQIKYKVSHLQINYSPLKPTEIQRDVSQGSCSAAKCSNRSEAKQKNVTITIAF